SLALLAWRSDRLYGTGGRGGFDSALSRETAFLVNNLLFVAFTFVVLLGTMYPLLAEAVRGVRVSVGGPYFDRMSVPIALGLVFLTGVGPALPWRRGSVEQLRRKLLWPAVAAAAAGLALAALGILRAPLAALTIVLAVFALGLLVGEFTGSARA